MRCRRAARGAIIRRIEIDRFTPIRGYDDAAAILFYAAAA